MGKEGLSRLVITVMGVAKIPAFYTRDLRDVHAAVLRAVSAPGAEYIEARLTATVSVVPDPEVGLRVNGMTQAIWGAVACGWLEPFGRGRSFGFRLLDDADTPIREAICALSTEERDAICQAGEAWVSASTARKKRARAAESPALL